MVDNFYFFDKSTKRKNELAEYCTFCDVQYRKILLSHYQERYPSVLDNEVGNFHFSPSNLRYHMYIKVATELTLACLLLCRLRHEAQALILFNNLHIMLMSSSIRMAWQIPFTLMITRNHLVAHSATERVRIVLYCHCKRPFLVPTNLKLCPILCCSSFSLWADYSWPLWRSEMLFLVHAVGIRITVSGPFHCQKSWHRSSSGLSIHPYIHTACIQRASLGQGVRVRAWYGLHPRQTILLDMDVCTYMRENPCSACESVRYPTNAWVSHSRRESWYVCI